MGFNEYNQFFSFLKSFTNPELFTNTLNNFNPSLDLSSFTNNAKKNIEVLANANQIAAKNLQNIAKRSAEIFQAESANLLNNIKNMSSSEGPEQVASHQQQYLRSSIESSVNHSKEILDLFSKSSMEVLQFIGQNISQNFDCSNNVNSKNNKTNK